MKTLLQYMVLLIGLLSITNLSQAQITSPNNDNATSSLDVKVKKLNAYIYPNPCVNEFNIIIEDQNQTEFTIKLMDVNYETITSNVYTAKNKGTVTFDFDISDLPSATYFIKVANKDGEATIKFMKQ